MGEKQNRPFHFSFNSSLKVDFQGSQIASDAGLLLVREFDERLGLNQLICDNLTRIVAARKDGQPALGGIFSRHRESKMQIPAKNFVRDSEPGLNGAVPVTAREGQNGGHKGWDTADSRSWFLGKKACSIP
jgi:hypothetical protein